jgi:hypothetical protein
MISSPPTLRPRCKPPKRLQTVCTKSMLCLVTLLSQVLDGARCREPAPAV